MEARSNRTLYFVLLRRRRHGYAVPALFENDQDLSGGESELTYAERLQCHGEKNSSFFESGAYKRGLPYKAPVLCCRQSVLEQ